MGLFDFALRPGQKFNKEELRILDKNFISISTYTKRKFRFERREISDNINGSHFGVDLHKVSYHHSDINLTEFDSEYIFQLDCFKLFIATERQYIFGLQEFFDSPHEKGSPNIKVPKIDRFPTFVLQVGWHGNGFLTEFKYNSDNKLGRVIDDPHLTNKCIKEIETNTIKFLKKL
jgi:hypothetical protein